MLFDRRSFRLGETVFRRSKDSSSHEAKAGIKLLSHTRLKTRVTELRNRRGMRFILSEE